MRSKITEDEFGNVTLFCDSMVTGERIKREFYVNQGYLRERTSTDSVKDRHVCQGLSHLGTPIKCGAGILDVVRREHQVAVRLHQVHREQACGHPPR